MELAEAYDNAVFHWYVEDMPLNGRWFDQKQDARAALDRAVRALAAERDALNAVAVDWADCLREHDEVSKIDDPAEWIRREEANHARRDDVLGRLAALARTGSSSGPADDRHCRQRRTTVGYIKHHAIVLVTFKHDLAMSARQAAVDSGLGQLVTPPIETPVNSDWTFAVLPDGSKEGWPDSDRFDEARARFMAWINDQAYEDGSNPFHWIEASFDDVGEVEILSVGPTANNRP